MDSMKVLEMVRHTVELGSSMCTYDRIKPILVLQSSKASFHNIFPLAPIGVLAPCLLTRNFRNPCTTFQNTPLSAKIYHSALVWGVPKSF